MKIKTIQRVPGNLVEIELVNELLKKGENIISEQTAFEILWAALSVSKQATGAVYFNSLFTKGTPFYIKAKEED